ncbi:hypothetical protein MCOR27_008661 [Pyricularia oryzae]|uniref:Zeta toxin domain-containing protein n=1 Tax=Pyricularia grisea TaxID=148305 RepID=A0ABQ8N629_PYRGI|nr:hypothetical protein MCOR01_004209 [Pyricularia oryzae]KAI6291886.1 hypothetical protein MCOR33_010262 [Pyricularia grisea]KAH9430864.1 hypothetical protein MCOR02_008189 [Pyricularia oryzae]KAI6253082.1 hypothetical protein MCOR19_010328 [Pyricularia oryzae]KAI6270165.1 hypothetical protein MCOR26_008368 [Pyricularia oryzae]
MADGKGALAKYVLTDAESETIFAEQIMPAELSHALDSGESPGSDSSSKVAVLLVGQTGAGKTRTAPLLHQAMTARNPSHRGPAHLIADTYKTYHPAYTDLMRQSPALASPATGPDARRWLAMACSRVAAAGADCLVESACRHPADFQDLVRIFQAAEYAVHVALLAVPEALSRLGILVRFHRVLPEARSRGLPLRLTPRPVHDATYAGLLIAATWLDREGRAAADRVVVLRRGDWVAYKRDAGDHGDDQGVASALLLERRRPLGEQEKARAIEDVKTLEELSLGLGQDREKEKQALEMELRDIKQLLLGLDPDSNATQADTPDFPELLPLNHARFIISRGING